LAEERLGVVPAHLNKSTLLIEEMCKNLSHVSVCLLGKFKGETGTNHHLITIINETVSGLELRWWIKKLVAMCKLEGRVHRPTFATPEGQLALLVDYDTLF
jgi:hypothetical protein